MTFNLISDIHADVNIKTGKVSYQEDFSFSSKNALSCIDSCMNHILSNRTKYGCIVSEEFSTAFDDARKFITEESDVFPARFKSIVDHIFSTGMLKNFDFKLNQTVKLINRKNATFCPEKLASADYLLIAGDLGYSNTYDVVLEDIKRKTHGKFKDVLCIPGNHDFWWLGDSVSGRKRPSKTDLSGKTIIKRDGDYLILGCTLWTPIQDRDIPVISRGMNDYRCSPGLTPYITRNEYEIQSNWLRKTVYENQDKKIIIFTHHQPFSELIPKKYGQAPINPAFTVMDGSMNDINRFGNVKLWHCGHTHDKYDGNMFGMRVIRNPIGYSAAYGFLDSEVSPSGWHDTVICV